MRSIKETVVNEFEIEKSRFITYLFNVDNVDKIKEIIIDLKKKYADATHVVHAFILENDSRSNDDNEPKGTAGLPSLEVLRKADMMNVLAVTIRYFGGIKLGAGGLLRAYTKGVSDALKLAKITLLTSLTVISLNVSYRDSSYLDKNLLLSLNVSKEYLESVNYKILIKDENIEEFKELFINLKDPYEFKIIESKKEYI